MDRGSEGDKGLSLGWLLNPAVTEVMVKVVSNEMTFSLGPRLVAVQKASKMVPSTSLVARFGGSLCWVGALPLVRQTASKWLTRLQCACCAIGRTLTLSNHGRGVLAMAMLA